MYVVARNAKGRPMLMHEVKGPRTYTTTCGLDVSPWSRAYFSESIPTILCLKCKRRSHG